MILEDAQESQLFQHWEGINNVRGWMGVPLIVRGEVIGYVALDNSAVTRL